MGANTISLPVTCYILMELRLISLRLDVLHSWSLGATCSVGVGGPMAFGRDHLLQDAGDFEWKSSWQVTQL